MWRSAPACVSLPVSTILWVTMPRWALDTSVVSTSDLGPGFGSGDLRDGQDCALPRLQQQQVGVLVLKLGPPHLGGSQWEEQGRGDTQG